MQANDIQYTRVHMVCSILSINLTCVRWEWLDRKSNTTIAVIEAPMNTVLLGQQVVDFRYIVVLRFDSNSDHLAHV